MSSFCCPTSRIRWSERVRHHFGGLVWGNWPWCLETPSVPVVQNNLQIYQPIPRVVHLRNAHGTDFIVEMEISSNIAPLWLMCFMSFIPIAPCVVLCSDVYATAWHFTLNPTDPDDLQLKIRKKNACTEIIENIYKSINCIYFEYFQDCDTDTDEIVWKERLVLNTVEEKVVTTSWYYRHVAVREVLEEIYRTVSGMIPDRIRRPPSSASHPKKDITVAKSVPVASQVSSANSYSEVVIAPAIALEEMGLSVEETPNKQQSPPETNSLGPEIEYSVASEVRLSGFWETPLHFLVNRIRTEFSFPRGLSSVQIIEIGCQDLGISPTHLQKIDAITVLLRLGITASDL